MTPLIRATLVGIAGLVPGLLAPGALVLPLLLGAGLALALYMRGWGGERASLLLFLLLGGAAGATAGTRARDACAGRWQQDQALEVRGYLTAAPVPGRAVGFQPTGPGCRDAIRVTLPRRGPALTVGAPLVLRGQWQPFQTASGWPQPAARLGVLRATAATPDTLADRARIPAVRAAAQLALRQTLPRRHGVAEALVLARTEALEPELRETFAAAGMAHLLAISGAHVLIFAGVLLLLLRLARVPLLPARIAALLLVAAYVAAIGAPPAAARAALQFALVMTALLLQRPAHAWTLLAAVALILLVLDPLSALDAGFQLSFAGVAGLIAYRRRIIEQLPGPLPAPLRDGVGTGLAATVATFPIAALHFGQFAPIGLLATLVASPIIALALPGLACLIAVHAVAPALTAWLAPGIELLLGALMAIARTAAAIPYGHFPVAASTLSTLLVLAAALLLWLAHGRGLTERPPPTSPAHEARHRRLRGLRVLQAVAAAAMLLAWAPRFSPAAGNLELHLIDVGQGDAIAIRTPHGRWLLVDAGMRTDRSDMGAKRVVPYLLQQGARRIDLLLLTHAHADHIGGAVSVMRAFDVGAVIDPGAPGASAQYLQTLHAAALEPARWITPRSGDQLVLDGVQLHFLYPREQLLDAPDDPNDFSLVFRVGFGRFGALFLGDAPQSVEEQLVAEHGTAMAAAVLKVGHHGSRTATAPALLDAVAPRVALISVGRDNRYGHPNPAVVARLLRHGVRVLRTDEHGSITIRAWRSGHLELGTRR